MGERTSAGLTHQFHAIALEENLSLRQLTSVFAGARLSAQKLYLPIELAGGVYAEAAPPSSFRFAMTTDVPSTAKRMAVPRPIPLAALVITATLLLSPPMVDRPAKVYRRAVEISAW